MSDIQLKEGKIKIPKHFKLGQTVFFLKENKVSTGKVNGVCLAPNNSVAYAVGQSVSYSPSFGRTDKEVFANKKDLLASL